MNNTIDFNKLLKSIEKAEKVEKEEQTKKDNIKRLVKKAQLKRG